jgi:hypothetical protein
MTEVRYPSPSRLLELPNEVLIKIFNSARRQDLPNVRLTCSRLCDTANPQFAKVNFTKRVYVVSPYSIDTLVDITKHPVFGGYVKTVVISSARQTTRPHTSPPLRWAESYNKDLCLNAYVKTRRFARRMERVFKNIRSHAGSVAISISDHPPVRNRLRTCGWTQLHDSLPVYMTSRLSETFEETIYAARRARCPVESLEILKTCAEPPAINHELDAAIRRVLESNLAPLNVNLSGRYQISHSHGSQHS